MLKIVVFSAEECGCGFCTFWFKVLNEGIVIGERVSVVDVGCGDASIAPQVRPKPMRLKLRRSLVRPHAYLSAFRLWVRRLLDGSLAFK